MFLFHSNEGKSSYFHQRSRVLILRRGTKRDSWGRIRQNQNTSIWSKDGFWFSLFPVDVSEIVWENKKNLKCYSNVRFILSILITGVKISVSLTPSYGNGSFLSSFPFLGVQTMSPKDAEFRSRERLGVRSTRRVSDTLTLWSRGVFRLEEQGVLTFPERVRVFFLPSPTTESKRT